MKREDIHLGTGKVKDLLCTITLPECKKLVLGFMYDLRRELLAAGIDEAKVRQAMVNALEDYSPACTAHNSVCAAKVGEAIENYINASDRGQDVLGRVLAHYCFKCPDLPARVPERGSEEDAHCRREFVPSLMPIPLADYFMISVRGSVEGVDAILSLPMLFGTDMTYLEAKQQECIEILADYRIGGDAEDAPIYWEGAFLDNRIRCLALELVRKTHSAIMDLGAEHYIRILENLETKHAHRNGQRRMEREFGPNDVAQLLSMLDAAVKDLEQSGLRCPVNPTPAVPA